MSDPLRPTQQTIAEQAGVTKATVSLALRNSPLLPESTRLRIQGIARDLQYRPNPMVNSLMTYVRMSKPPSFHATIAFVTNFAERDEWMRGRVFPDWYHGARERAASLGYVVDHFWLREPGMNPKRASDVLWNRGVKGMIFAPMASAREVLDLDFSKFSSVAIGYTLREPGLPCVSSNHLRDMITGLRELKGLGYRHIGIAVPRSIHERIDYAWLAALEMAQHMGCGPTKVSKFGLKEWGEKPFVDWLHRNKPEIVISCDEPVLAWIRAEGLSVPGDVGYMDLNCAEHRTEVSGIDQNVKQAGIVAAEMVIARIERNECGVPSHSQVVLVEGDWVPGSTLRNIR
ncbi:hypothetical protein BH09VER1_BH09VER1_07520 [soil metagenome]